MSEIGLSIEDDYPLTGCITYFEAYCFATTPKHYSEHSDFADGVVVDGKRGIISVSGWNDLTVRKKMLTLFNDKLKQVVTNFPKPSWVSAAMIDLIGDAETSDDEYLMMIESLKGLFVKWCVENDRIGACCVHMWQGSRYPHVHILYPRGRGKHNEFQDWLRTL